MFRACASMPRTSATVLPARSADRVFTPLFTVIAILSPPFFFYFLFFLLSRPRCGGVRHDIKIHLGFLPIHFSLLERIKRIEHQSCGGEIRKDQLRRTGRQLLTAHLVRRFIARGDELRVIFFQPASFVFTLPANEHLDVSVRVFVPPRNKYRISEGGAVVGHHFSCLVIIQTRENDVSTANGGIDGVSIILAIRGNILGDRLHTQPIKFTSHPARLHLCFGPEFLKGLAGAIFFLILIPIHEYERPDFFRKLQEGAEGLDHPTANPAETDNYYPPLSRLNGRIIFHYSTSSFFSAPDCSHRRRTLQRRV